MENHFEEFENKQNFIIAKKRYRIIAFVFDFIVFWILGTALAYLFNQTPESGIGFDLTGIPAFIMLVFIFFLWPISEGIWGQTLGKRILDIKVVKTNGDPVELSNAIGRFFLGFIDCFFLIGIIVAAVNKKNQRIGDAAANTVVIKLQKNT